MKFNGSVKIIERKQLQQDVFQIKVERPSMIEEILPGQFFNIVASNTGYPLLRRPISVSGYSADIIEFTVKVLGTGTQALSEYEVGETIVLMGPLGNGFEQKVEKRVLLVGGGIGIAPIKGLLEQLAPQAVSSDVILGFRDEPYLVEMFSAHASSLTLVSEYDASYRLGYVTQPFIEHIEANAYDMIYACGPEAMLKTLAGICNSRKLPIQLLMEEKMACGIGACLVCTCKVKQGDFGFKHVRMCKEGPMFYGSEVIFDAD
ncbi:dihydroorotate dehydrogenase electron transfer subunit [Carnobacterium alterfunditum]|uniref:dihydroorotate dehydrogenase electron transfer subunit n=1 Tax=Carnobacterium alterfunditum TaxID=28230 RepID=UPI003592F505